MKTNPGIKALAIIASIALLIPISINWYSFLARTFTDDSLEYTVLTDSNTTFNILSDSTVAVGKCSLSQTKNISIPEKVCTRGKEYTVTSIGNKAFSYCHELTNIKIPESVSHIGKSAFNKCSSLTNFKIPKSVTCIEAFAFYECFHLTYIEIPESVKYIGNAAFFGCSSLKIIEIPKNVRIIGYSAFARCRNLNVVIDNSKYKVKIGKDAFNGCKSVRYND